MPSTRHARSPAPLLGAFSLPPMPCQQPLGPTCADTGAPSPSTVIIKTPTPPPPGSPAARHHHPILPVGSRRHRFPGHRQAAPSAAAASPLHCGPPRPTSSFGAMAAIIAVTAAPPSSFVSGGCRLGRGGSPARHGLPGHGHQRRHHFLHRVERHVQDRGHHACLHGRLRYRLRGRRLIRHRGERGQQLGGRGCVNDHQRGAA